MASLDTLPVELMDEILLNAPDIYSLRALVHSSPAYHQVYLASRTKILSHIIFGSVCPESYYEYVSLIKARNFRRDNTAREDANFLEFYRPHELHDTSEVLRGVTFKQLLQIKELINDHNIVMEKYIASLSSTPPIQELNIKREDLSTRERRRFERALCRFDFVCTIAGNYPSRFRDPEFERNFLKSRVGSRPNHFPCIPWQNVLMNNLELWETEEIGCFANFAKKFYTEFMWKLHRRSPRLCELLAVWAKGANATSWPRDYPSRHSGSLALMSLLTIARLGSPHPSGHHP